MAEKESPNNKDNKKADEVAEEVSEKDEVVEEPSPEELADAVEPVEAVEEVTKEEEKEVKELRKEEESRVEDFRTGDTVRILYKIIEGKKERLQPYEGIVIGRKGHGMSKTFTVRRIGADRIGVERIFPLHSPNIVKLEVKRKGKVRRAKLYYLRNKVGRAATKVKERK